MKLIVNQNQESVIAKALLLAENIAFGDVSGIFEEYASNYKIKSLPKETEIIAKKMQVVFPSRIAEIRELRNILAFDKEFDLTQLISLGRILEGYSRIGQGQFNYTLNEFTEECQGEKLVNIPEYLILRKQLTNLDRNASWSLNQEQPYNFRLAYEISRKIIYDISWIQHPTGGMSSNFELPFKLTKDSFVEIR